MTLFWFWKFPAEPEPLCWSHLLTLAKFCSNDVQGTLNHEHTKARNMVIDVKHADCGPIKLVNTPMKFSESKPGLRSPPPTLGQHTYEVLSEHLGLSSDEISTLKEKGVVR